MYIGFDPGRDKCGVAIVDAQGQPLWHQVVAETAVLKQLTQLQQDYAISQLIMGDQTASRDWQKTLQQAFPSLAIVLVDERYSSLEARDRYWQMYPPRGIGKLVPLGMRQPPCPIDDIVAIILVERFFAAQNVQPPQSE